MRTKKFDLEEVSYDSKEQMIDDMDNRFKDGWKVEYSNPIAKTVKYIRPKQEN